MALPRLALTREKPCVEINREETPMSSMYTWRLRGMASDAMKALWDATEER